MQVGNNPVGYKSLLPVSPQPNARSVGEPRANHEFPALCESRAKHGQTDFLLEHARFETFLFVPRKAGRKFMMGEGSSTNEMTLSEAIAMQATTPTQLQWALALEEAPSHFTEGGHTIRIAGKDLKILPNHPVETIKYFDTDRYEAKLTELDPKFNYRKPYETEFEEAARAGAKTTFAHGRKAV